MVYPGVTLKGGGGNWILKYFSVRTGTAFSGSGLGLETTSMCWKQDHYWDFRFSQQRLFKTQVFSHIRC
jgi:hypothetical protein